MPAGWPSSGDSPRSSRRSEVAAAFGDHDMPSTLLGVTVLGYSGQFVEIEAMAAAAR
jgi:hypothetical protein